MSQRQQLERIMEIDRRICTGEYLNAERMAEVLEVSHFGSKEYFKHNKELLFYERQKELILEVEKLGI